MAQFPALPIFTDALIADTSHLDAAEFGLYMRLLILMWRTPGCSIPNDPAWITKRMAGVAFETLKPIIEEFCKIKAGRITQKRLQKEFEYLHNRSKAQKERAQNGWKNKQKSEEKSEEKKEAVPVNSLKQNELDLSPNDAPHPTPPTPTEEKGLSKDNPKKKMADRPDDVPDDVWSDFKAMRDRKHAPITTTALDGIRREAEKAGWTLEAALRECCVRGWQGFKAEFVNKGQGRGYAAKTAASDNNDRFERAFQNVRKAGQNVE